MLVAAGRTHLGARNEEEAAGEQESLQRRLAVAELDTLQIQHALTVGQHQRVQRQDLEHLQRRHQCTAALLDDVTHCNSV